MKYLTVSLPTMALFAMLIISCNKSPTSSIKKATSLHPNAKIINTGEVAADGCGWLVKINSNYYHPDNLPVQFQKDSLDVAIEYDSLSTKFQCSMNPNNLLPVIHIKSIN